MNKSGLSRDTIDKFYTCDKSVQLCIKALSCALDISKDDVCIEPSAGGGAFVKCIKDIFKLQLLFYFFLEILLRTSL